MDNFDVFKIKEPASNLDELKDYNDKCLNIFLHRPFFKMMRNGTLNNLKKRKVFLECLQVFANFFQYCMFARQATCFDEKYKSVFLQHFKEELGHDELLALGGGGSGFSDPILETTSCWFAYQMFVRDNIEKTALVFLVLEVTGDCYAKAAHEAMPDTAKGYYELHVEVEEDHVQMGERLLQGLSAEMYQKLQKLVQDGWCILTAMTDRVSVLVSRAE